MKGYQFEDTQGTFHLKKAENISYLYFPIAGEAGLKVPSHRISAVMRR